MIKSIQPINRLIFPIVSIILALLIYMTILTLPIPKEIGLAMRFGLVPVILYVIFFLYPAFRLPGRIGKFASFSLTLVLFSLPLSGAWNSGYSYNYFLDGGLLPFSDAQGYYQDAQLLLEGQNFSFFASRRPLATGVLATILGLTHHNLQVTLAILVLITALSGFLLMREIQRSHGTVAGLVVLTILFLFYRDLIGTTATENIGLSLGAVGLAIMWRGSGKKSINMILLGIFVLTLALHARAGAFLVLPALIVWGSRVFHGYSLFSWHFLIGSISVVFLGFVVNFIVLKVANPDGISNSNFSYGLYGLADGGSGWQRVKSDYPELNIQKHPEVEKRIYQLAWEKIRVNPLGLMKGLWYGLKKYWEYVFFFTKEPNFLSITLIAQAGFFLFMFWGILRCYHQQHILYNSLIFLVTVGILFSSPVLVDGGYRVYAATIPMTATLVMLGMIPMIQFIEKITKWGRLPQYYLKNINWSYQPLIFFSITLVFLVSFGPIVIKTVSQPPQFTQEPCSSGQETMYVRISPGAWITLVEDCALQQTQLPFVRISDFYPTGRKTNNFTFFKTGTTILKPVNLESGKFISYLLIKHPIPLNTDGIMKVCGYLEAGNYIVNSIQPVSETVMLEQKSTAIPDKTVVVHQRNANRFLEIGDLDRTAAEYTQIIRLSTDRQEIITTLINQAQLFLQHHQLDKAVANYTKMLTLAPTCHEGYIRRAQIYNQMGNLEKAIADYTQVILLNKLKAWYVSWLENFIPGGKNELITAYETRADLYQKSNQLDKAIADYTQILSLIPEINNKVIDTYQKRALLYEKMERLDKAIADYSKVIVLGSRFGNSRAASKARASLYYRTKQWDQAINDYHRVIGLTSGSEKSIAHLGRGRAYTHQNNWRTAIADFTAAIKLNPKLAEAYFERGKAYWRLSIKDKALLDLHKVLEMANDVQLRQQAQQQLLEIGKD
jgi:tetratricopeptide (TPR) repeat protein